MQRVVVNDHTDPKMRERMLIQKLDVTNWAQWEEVYAAAKEKFGEIDVHMNVAGG